MTYAVAMEYLESNPVHEGAASGARAVRGGGSHHRRDGSDPPGRRAASILTSSRILWVTAEEGGRRGETLALRWGDIDVRTFHASTIRAVISAGLRWRPHGARTKTQGSRARSPFPPSPSNALCAHRTWRTSSGSPRPQETRSPSNPRTTCSAAVMAVADPRSTASRGDPILPPDASAASKQHAGVRREVDLHGLRHTMITELLTAGVDPRTVMGRAGHASPTMTMSVYAKVRPASDREAAEVWATRLDQAVQQARQEPAVSRIAPALRTSRGTGWTKGLGHRTSSTEVDLDRRTALPADRPRSSSAAAGIPSVRIRAHRTRRDPRGTTRSQSPDPSTAA